MWVGERVGSNRGFSSPCDRGISSRSRLFERGTVLGSIKGSLAMLGHVVALRRAGARFPLESCGRANGARSGWPSRPTIMQGRPATTLRRGGRSETVQEGHHHLRNSGQKATQGSAGRSGSSPTTLTTPNARPSPPSSDSPRPPRWGSSRGLRLPLPRCHSSPSPSSGSGPCATQPSLPTDMTEEPQEGCAPRTSRVGGDHFGHLPRDVCKSHDVRANLAFEYKAGYLGHDLQEEVAC